MLSVCSLQSNHKHFFLGRGFSKCLSPSPALRRVGDIATTSCICEGVPPPACDFLRVPTPCYVLEPRVLVVGPEAEQSDTQKLIILPPNLKQPLLSLLVSALVQIPAQILLHLVLRCRVQGADRKQSLLSSALCWHPQLCSPLPSSASSMHRSLHLSSADVNSRCTAIPLAKCSSAPPITPPFLITTAVSIRENFLWG